MEIARKQKIDNAVSKFNGEGIEAYGYRFDVTDEKSVMDSVGKIESEVGPIDILVNNAGIIKRTPLADMESKILRKLLM